MGIRRTGISEYEWTVYYQGSIQKISDERYRILQSLMFLEIWTERGHDCEVSGKPLKGDEARTYYFHHILEKRNYELYSLCKWNIVVLDWLIHDRYERKNDTIPQLVQIKQDLIIQLDSNKYAFDNQSIWQIDSDYNRVISVFGNTIKQQLKL